MDINLGVYHCQRKEAILTATREHQALKESEGIPAAMSEWTGGEPSLDSSARIRGPGDRVKPNTLLHVLERRPTST